MTNVKATVSADGKVLTIVVDLTKDYGPSASGKSRTVASTGGFTSIEGTDARLNVNVIRSVGRGREE